MPLDPVLSETFFGSTLFQYVLFFGILAVGAVLGRSIGFLYETRLKKRAYATKTEIDDIILYALGKPVILLAMVLAAAVGRTVLTPTTEIARSMDIGIEVFVIVLIAWTAIRLTDGLIKSYIGEYVEQTTSKLDDALVPVVSRITNIAIVSIAGIVILDTVGYNVTAIIASLGIGGIAVAFASRRALTDLFGGIHIFSTKPFLVDDFVEIDGKQGQVEEIGLRTTQIRDFDGRLITIPNATVANTEVTNISSEPTRRVKRFIDLSYETAPEDVATATDLAIEAINEIDDIDTERTGAWFWEYGDWGLRIQIQYHIQDVSAWKEIIDSVNRNLQETFDEAGLEIAVPAEAMRADIEPTG